ncbi:hypothetical protein ACWD4O_46500 [Streptomyces sp. NPDC002623]
MVGLKEEQGDVFGVPAGAAGAVDEAVHESVQGKPLDSPRWCARSAMVWAMSMPGTSTRPSV